MISILKNARRGLIKEVVTFAGTIIVCIILCFFLCRNFPAHKRLVDYIAEALFSALFAVPTGAAWRSLHKARSKQ